METWTAGDYALELAGRPGRSIAEKVFALVWRFDFTAPGFCLLDAGPGLDSHSLRTWMVELKEALSEANVRQTGKPFVFRSLARFDQQETTKFHLDGAPAQSMLLLGYEPSNVRTRLGFAVENVAEVVRALEGTGAKIVTPPKETAWGLQAVAKDPDGRSVELTQRR